MIKMYNALDESITMPITMSWTSLNRGRRVPITEILSGGGVLSGREKPEIRHFSANGSIYYQDYASMRAFLDGLLTFLENSPIRVYQENVDSRFIYARCINVVDNWLDGRAELELTIDFVASDPYFYSTEHIDTQQFTEEKEFTIHVGGNVITYPTILLNKNSGTIEDLKIENLTNSRSLSLSDDISSDIMIDNKNLLILSESTSIISMVNTGWLIDSLILQPGENTFKLYGTGTFDYTVIMKWRSKWL